MAESRAAWAVRSLAFVRKELVEIIRQPRLVLTLILGPFLILLVFGLGYLAAPPPLEMLVVAPAGSP